MLRSVANHQPLQEWAGRLRGRVATESSETVQEIARLTADNAGSALDLAGVILRDLPLTARVLRAANSFYHNPGRRPIQTVGNAVAALGFDTVRRIALSIAVIQGYLGGPHRGRILQALARNFHAATQARGFAGRFADEDPEEVFVAALLHGVGELAFWSSGDPVTYELDTALRQPGANRHAAEERVLGFRLAELTARLNKTWRAGELLEASLREDDGGSARVRYVRYGHQVAACAEQGWPGAALSGLAAELAGVFRLAASELPALIREHTREAACLTASYEAVDVSRLILQPQN